MPQAKDTIDGKFYTFDRGRAGQEIGRMIPREFARQRVSRAEDVYTPLDSDARSLAKDVQKGKADWEGAHDSDYFPHYHPAGNHEDYGHIFYGQRGYREGDNRR